MEGVFFLVFFIVGLVVDPAMASGMVVCIGLARDTRGSRCQLFSFPARSLSRARHSESNTRVCALVYENTGAAGKPRDDLCFAEL
jgi:hypothetical protein